ncbi:hypothetical protein EW145_g6536 [Phellinidium pouzarii]|uniref:DDE-1 domain-containing protein n=1 Tax=Phellinidium pouzarii TaxID=167371 RepID=A0A4S4KWB6_9AGAM|nr:hypothetical protein EW145_g6536 [Phellinidium pouzarii]
MDTGIIHAFKAHYQHLYVLGVLDCDEEGVENICQIDQLEEMNLATQAWAYVTSKTIENYWQHENILNYSKKSIPIEPSFNDDTGLTKAVADLQNALEKLSIGTTTAKSVHTVEELLDIAGENVTKAEWC